MPSKTFLTVLLGLVLALGSLGCEEPPNGSNGGGGGASSWNSDYGYGGRDGCSPMGQEGYCDTFMSYGSRPDWLRPDGTASSACFFREKSSDPPPSRSLPSRACPDRSRSARAARAQEMEWPSPEGTTLPSCEVGCDKPVF